MFNIILTNIVKVKSLLSRQRRPRSEHFVFFLFRVFLHIWFKNSVSEYNNCLDNNKLTSLYVFTEIKKRLLIIPLFTVNLYLLFFFYLFYSNNMPRRAYNLQFQETSTRAAECEINNSSKLVLRWWIRNSFVCLPISRDVYYTHTKSSVFSLKKIVGL